MTLRALAAQASTLALAAAAAPGAAAAAVPRQTYAGAFTASAPGAPSGLTIAFDYRHPDGTARKPPAVARVLQELHPGARIDPTVPERCTAPDAALVARGAAACPAGSVVGGGTLHADVGARAPGAPRVVEFDVTLINAPAQLILFLEGRNVPSPVRLASRSRVVGDAAYLSETPPLPAADPADPFTAISHVRLTIRPVVRAGRSYITTPPACPPSGAWTNRGTFTYRDGVTETVAHQVPCTASAPPAVAESTTTAARRTALALARPPASAHRLNRRRAIGVALRVDGRVRDVRIRLVDRGGRTIARVHAGAVARDTRLVLARTGRARPGHHTLVAEATAGGERLRVTRPVRLRR